MQPYLQFFAWGNYYHLSYNDISDFLYQSRPRMIEFLSPEEWKMDNPVVNPLIDYAKDNNVEVRVLLNSFNMWNNSPSRPALRNVIYEDSPTLILNYVLGGYTQPHINEYNKGVGNIDFYQTESDIKDYKYKIISMTNKALSWRGKMIDHFQQLDIINGDNCIIWQNSEHGEPYDYKYFKPRVLSDEQFKDENGSFNSMKLPVSYADSWFAAVAETGTDILSITEKTITPILYLKPFLILGSKGFHSFLKILGFKLFEELIDYSFDSEDDESTRVEMFCKEIAKINALSSQEILVYQQLFKDRLTHNKENTYRLYYNKMWAPRYTTHWSNIIPNNKIILPDDINAQSSFYRSMSARGWYNKALLSL